jgi:regulator of protease activity HflC (stomatin/prohibitin superfamily)
MDLPKGEQVMKRFMVLMSLVLALAVSGACTRIGPGHVGIKVSNAGSDRGVNKDAITTGWVFYNPMLSSVYEWPTYVQQVVLTASAQEGNPVNEEITFTNADNMAIAADIGFSYSLDPQKVPEFFNKFLTDDMLKFSHGYMRSLIRDKFNEVGSKYKIEQIMGDNAQFIAEVKAAVQKECDPFGVKLESQFGFIGAPRPPKSVVDMINSKVAAVQLAQQKQNELVQAQADAAKTVATAEGAAKSLTLTAKAQAEANRILSESLTPNLIELKRIEKWDGKYPLSTQGSVPVLQIK